MFFFPNDKGATIRFVRELANVFGALTPGWIMLMLFSIP